MAGVERKIDNLGRVVIPIEYRKSSAWALTVRL